MRRFWISLTVLFVLFCLTIYNTHYLKAYTEELTVLLNQAGLCAADGDWDAAYDKTEAALDRWNSHETFLHAVFLHQDTDEILLSFQEVKQLIIYQEDGGEYSAANARLITQIGLLYEMEQLNWKNLM